MMDDLAKRAVACSHWRWLPGMLCIWPNGTEWRVGQVNGVDGKNDLPNYASNGWGDDYTDRTTGMPDLTDPATLGAVESLLPPQWYVVGSPDGWRIDCYLVPSGVSSTTVGDLHSYETRADLLIAALEAAEGREVNDD